MATTPIHLVASWPDEADRLDRRYARGIALAFSAAGLRHATALCLGPDEGWLVLDSAGEPHGPYTAFAARVALAELLGQEAATR